MAPPLEELLVRTGLPDKPDPYYDGMSVGDVAPCGTDDTLKFRLVPGKNATGSYIDYPEVKSLNPLFRGTAIDDSLLRVILTSAGGFVFEHRGRNGLGEEVFENRVLHLCRVDSKTPDGVNAIYISGNAVFNNQPSAPAALRRVQFAFRPEEIMAIVHGLKTEENSPFRVPGDHYQVDPADHTQLSLMPDRTEINNIIAMIERTDSPIAANRRAPIVAALRRTVEAENEQFNQFDFIRRSTERQNNMMWIMLAVTAPPTLIMAYALARQNGWTKPIDHLVDGAFRTFWKVFGQTEKVDFVKELTRPMVESGKVRKAVGRESDYEAMREHYHRRIARILTVTARAGEGKTHFIDGIAHEIFTDKIPEVSSKNARVFRVSLGELVGHSDVKYVGQMQARWNDFTRQVDQALKQGLEVVVTIDEIHRLNGLGATSGGGANDLGNTVKDWISSMESDTRIRMFGATTVAEYPQLVALRSPEANNPTVDEALVRRFPQLRLGTLNRAGLRDILVKVANDWQSQPIRGVRDGSKRLVIPPEVIDRALDLGSHPSVKIANPDAALTILDMAQARAARLAVDGKGDGRVTLDILNDRFAEEFNLNATESRSWRSEGNGGVSRLKDVFTEKTFADQIRAHYEDLRDPKFDQLVGAAASVAQKSWDRAYQASPDHPPVTIAGDCAFPREDFMQEALRGLADAALKAGKAHALAFKLIVDRGAVSPGHVKDLPADLVESGRRAFAAVQPAPEVSSEARKEAPAEREKELLRDLIDENPQFFPDSEKLLRLLEETRLAETKTSENREPVKLEDLVDRYAAELKLEKDQTRILKLAVRSIDARLESARREERERKEKEKGKP